MEEGARLVLASKKDRNGGAAHQHTKKVVWGGAPAARTRAWPWHGEERRHGGAPASATPTTREAVGVEGGSVKGVVEGGSPAYEEGGAEVGQPDSAKPKGLHD
jgi:hypothetical protein